MFEFYECSNYRGNLQVKEENGKFFWRVSCQIDQEYQFWHEIPVELGLALKQYHTDTAEQRKPSDTDNDDESIME